MNTIIQWKGPGWYAGRVVKGMTRTYENWVRLDADNEQDAMEQARHKKLGTPTIVERRDVETFDEVEYA